MTGFISVRMFGPQLKSKIHSASREIELPPIPNQQKTPKSHLRLPTDHVVLFQISVLFLSPCASLILMIGTKWRLKCTHCSGLERQSCDDCKTRGRLKCTRGSGLEKQSCHDCKPQGRPKCSRGYWRSNLVMIANRKGD